MSINGELNGKTAFVTGGSRGIGRATALALARQGAKLIIHFSNAVEPAREVVFAIRAESDDRKMSPTSSLFLCPIVRVG